MPNDIRRGCRHQKSHRQRHQRSNPGKDPRNRSDPVEPDKNPGSTSKTRLKSHLERDLSISLGLHLKAPFMRPTASGTKRLDPSQNSGIRSDAGGPAVLAGDPASPASIPARRPDPSRIPEIRPFRPDSDQSGRNPGTSVRRRWIPA
jgi:hypothetical protein